MNRIINLELVELVLENVFEGVVIEQEPFPVFVDYVGENSVKVWNSAYSKTIKMKDTFLDDFFGNTYESKINKAKIEAFEAIYSKVKNDEINRYNANKFKK